LELWETPWDPSQWWTPSWLSNKDLPKNDEDLPQNKPMINPGKVMAMSDHVSKTETTNVMNSSFSITSAQTQDGMELDMTKSNVTISQSMEQQCNVNFKWPMALGKGYGNRFCRGNSKNGH